MSIKETLKNLNYISDEKRKKFKNFQQNLVILSLNFGNFFGKEGR